MADPILKNSLARIDELRKALIQNPNFKEYEFLRDFVEQYAAIKGKPAKIKPNRRKDKPRNIPDAVLRAIEDAGAPLPSRKLLVILPRYGKTVKGKDQVANLSSVLSPDPRFRSVKWQNKSAWWIDGRPIPPEPSGDGNDAATSSPTSDLKGGD